MAESNEDLRHKVALSCRILAAMGLVKDILGHVSVRLPGADEMLVRCRHQTDERGLIFTTDDDIRRTDFAGEGADLAGQYFSPGEVSIHGESLRLRPEIGCVIHAHPPGALMCGLGGVELRPILGAYDGGFTFHHTLAGVPVFPHGYLISRPELAHRMIAFMGPRNVCIMKGHGVTITGRTVEETTIRALRFEAMCRIAWQLALAGKTADDVSPDTANEFSRRTGDVSSGLTSSTADMTWRYYVAMVESGVEPPVSVGVGDIEI